MTTMTHYYQIHQLEAEIAELKKRVAHLERAGPTFFTTLRSYKPVQKLHTPNREDA